MLNRECLRKEYLITYVTEIYDDATQSKADKHYSMSRTDTSIDIDP
jgi:hypothetical protein